MHVSRTAMASGQKFAYAVAVPFHNTATDKTDLLILSMQHRFFGRFPRDQYKTVLENGLTLYPYIATNLRAQHPDLCGLAALPVVVVTAEFTYFFNVSKCGLVYDNETIWGHGFKAEQIQYIDICTSGEKTICAALHTDKDSSTFEVTVASFHPQLVRQNYQLDKFEGMVIDFACFHGAAGMRWVVVTPINVLFIESSGQKTTQDVDTDPSSGVLIEISYDEVCFYLHNRLMKKCVTPEQDTIVSFGYAARFGSHVFELDSKPDSAAEAYVQCYAQYCLKDMYTGFASEFVSECKTHSRSPLALVNGLFDNNCSDMFLDGFAVRKMVFSEMDSMMGYKMQEISETLF